MSDSVEKLEKFEVIKHKIDSLVMAVRDISNEEINDLTIKEMHDVDKHVFEILKILEKY